MINEGDGKEVKNDYLDILDGLIKHIQEKANQKELPVSDDITIYSSGRQVYKGVAGEEPSKNLLTSDQLENISKAINDPQQSKGTISIKIGKAEVFRIQDGKITNDTLGLAPAQTLSKVDKPERTYSVESLQKQVKVLQDRLDAQQKTVDDLSNAHPTPEALDKLAQQIAEMGKNLEKQQALIENTQKVLSQANQRSLPPVKNTALQNWVGNVENKAKQAAKKTFGFVKNAIAPEVTKLKTEFESLRNQAGKQLSNFSDQLMYKTDAIAEGVSQQVGNAAQGVRKQVDQKVKSVQSNINKTRNQLGSAVENTKGRVIEKSIKAMLDVLGKNNPDGSKSFKSASFDFERQGDNVIVRTKAGETILDDGVLSADVSQEQLQALDKVQSVVDMHQQNKEKTSQVLQGKGLRRQ